VDDPSREFLRHLAIDVRIEFGELPIRKLTGDMGYITSEAWHEFTTSTSWNKYQEELLEVAELQSQLSAQEKQNSALEVGSLPSTDAVDKSHTDLRSTVRKAFVVPLLRKHGMTRSKLATKAGIDPSVVYDYLSGKSDPRPDNRNLIAEVLGIQESELPDCPPRQNEENQNKPKNAQSSVSHTETGLNIRQSMPYTRYGIINLEAAMQRKLIPNAHAI
jgi:transcriptional regulator with XRE-family HTH domain